MRTEDDRHTAIKADATHKAHELPCLNLDVLVPAEQISQRVQDHKAGPGRLNLTADLPQERPRHNDVVVLASRREKCVLAG
jgi:hypothetical protein